MYNYAAWFNRALAFVDEIGHRTGARVEGTFRPPLARDELARLEAESRLPIPRSLRDFWTSAAAESDRRYYWELPASLWSPLAIVSNDRFRNYIWGGPEICSSSESVELGNQAIDDWARETEYPRDARLWERSFPVFPVGNGDYVGLYTRDDDQDPPVVYLCHEAYGDSCILAENLATFLAQWEELGFVGIDFVRNFCRDRDGLLAIAEHPVERSALNIVFSGDSPPEFERPQLIASEQEWLDCENPDRLARWATADGTHHLRKLRLYCCACCRRVWRELGETGRLAVETSEAFADGNATTAQLQAARAALSGGFSSVQADNIAALIDFSQREGRMQHVGYAAVDSVWYIASNITHHFDEPLYGAERRAQADLARHVFGNPWRPVKPPKLRDIAILRLAERLYKNAEGASELVEALEGAGLAQLAEHFREPEHPRGCWALDILLDKC